MAAAVLGNAGYDVLLLGADLPMAELGPAVDHHRPAVVGLTVTLPSLAPLLPEAVDEVRSVAPRAGLLIGGQVAPRATAARPGVVLCRHVSDAVELADALVQRAA